MPSKGLKMLANLEEEALAMASIKSTNSMKKTTKLLSKELSTSSSSSSALAATVATASEAPATATGVSESTSSSSSSSSSKVSKTKEKIVKYKNSKSKTTTTTTTIMENLSTMETTMLEEIKDKEQQQQNISSSTIENMSKEKMSIEKLPKSSLSCSSSSTTSVATTITNKASANATTIVQDGTNKDEMENYKIDGTMKATSTAKMANGKKSAKVKASKKQELIKQQQQQQQLELMANQQNGQREQTICKKCQKPVYKMEEVKAEKQTFHKNCFRCSECDKQLKVDNYQSHEGILYCCVHFKLLFAPKHIEDEKPEVPQKPELIIRENQPAELPPDVVRASEKPNLGLEELHQLNLRSRFQLFEKDGNNASNEEVTKVDRTDVTVKRSATILAKMAKLTQQQQQQKKMDKNRHNDSEEEDDGKRDVEDMDNNSSDENSEEFLCSDEKLRQMQREQPLGLGDAMNDIRTRFENGPGLLKEERREERKQEIQNIRSRLFMGKQARIKEMYQQAVAQSAQCKQSTSKQLDIQVEVDAHRLKERFERGEINNNHNLSDEQNNDAERQLQNERKCNTLAQEAEVFEYGISKASRNLFMEIDANVKASNQSGTQLNLPKKFSNSTANILNYNKTNGEQESLQRSSEIVKCDENTEDVVIKTSEISEKFKFFEKYQPVEEKRREFRITPPREGVVKMPSPEQENDVASKASEREPSPGLLRSNTTTVMLSKFRQLEKQNYKLNHRNHHHYGDYDDDDYDYDDDYDDDDNDDDDYNYNDGPRPLKRFTPPPEGEKQYYTNKESDYDDDDNDDNDNDYHQNDDNDNYGSYKDDEALREARAAARAKQLRMKFEKWQSNEMAHETHDGRIDVYSSQVSDDTTIESAKVLRERFENMKNTGTQQQHPSRPRYEVKRFV